MPSDTNYRWILELTADQLREYLAGRELTTVGSLAVLRARLSRYEKAQVNFHTPRGAPDVSENELVAEPGVAGAAGGTRSRTRSRRRSAAVEVLDRDDSRTRIPRMAELSPAEYDLPRIDRPRVEPAFRPEVRGPPSTWEVYKIMTRWDLSFSGAVGTDAEAFLSRIREGRKMVLVEDVDIFRCLPFFLSGVALQWYRLNDESWDSWRDFELDWRERFGVRDYQFALREEILRRTQGENETVSDYLTMIGALFKRLDPPWSRQEQISFAHHNMLPRLQISVRKEEINSLKDLERVASGVERNYEAAKTFRAPPPPSRSLFPELAYNPPARTMRRVGTAAVTEEREVSSVTNKISDLRLSDTTPKRKPVSEPAVRADVPAKNRETVTRTRNPNPAKSAKVPTTPAQPSSGDESRGLRCWNCQQPGHLARECPKPAKTHCYRCGRQGSTLRNCPNCSGNGQGNR